MGTEIIYRCDLCGKTERTGLWEYQIKRRLAGWGWMGHRYRWEGVMAHTSCVRKLLNAATEGSLPD